jgi:hypothetical protein
VQEDETKCLSKVWTTAWHASTHTTKVASLAKIEGREQAVKGKEDAFQKGKRKWLQDESQARRGLEAKIMRRLESEVLFHEFIFDFYRTKFHGSMNEIYCSTNKRQASTTWKVQMLRFTENMLLSLQSIWREGLFVFLCCSYAYNQLLLQSKRVAAEAKLTKLIASSQGNRIQWRADVLTAHERCQFLEEQLREARRGSTKLIHVAHKETRHGSTHAWNSSRTGNRSGKISARFTPKTDNYGTEK